MVSNPDDSSHPDIAMDHQLHPKCMTDLVEAQSNNKIISEIIQLFKAKELQCQKGKKTDSHEMR